MAGVLVIGYEPTAEGDDAVALGRLLAEALDLTPVVTTVVRAVLEAPQADVDGRAEEAARPALDRAKAALEGLESRAQVATGRSVAGALHEVVARERAAAVVVGSSHRGSLGRVLIGGVAESLLQGAQAAVVVAPRGFAEREQRTLLRVGVAFDGSPEAWSALGAGVDLAARLRARLAVATVAEPAPIGYGATIAVLGAGDFDFYETRDKQQVLDRGLRTVPDGLPVEGHLLRGSAGPTLASFGSDVDLLVLGSRGYGPLRRVVLGSSAAHVMRHARCAVMMLTRAAGDDPFHLREGSHAAAAS